MMNKELFDEFTKSQLQIILDLRKELDESKANFDFLAAKVIAHAGLKGDSELLEIVQSYIEDLNQ